MIILVDIGNSRAKFLFKQELILNETALVVNNSDISIAWLTQNWSQASKIIVASVADNKIITLIESWVKEKGIKLTKINSEQQNFSVISFYTKPEQLGVDRWLGLLGANKLFPNKNVLIVDAGTATTIDCLMFDGQHKGGWILPGIDMMLSSLINNTANITAQINRQANIDFGANTSDNVNSACWAATIGTIELAIAQSSVHFPVLDYVILTGGNANQLKSLLSHSTVVVENLVFHGLARY